MSDLILGGDFKVYYEAENRQKRIVWNGSATGTRSVNELYSALQDLFDELTQLDDGSPMSAQTPTEYTIGIIDTGDKNPWFIDRTTVEHLYGGALKTASWKRDIPGNGTTTNTGIVRVFCNNTSIVEGDIGLDITHTDGDAGTLLDVKGTGAGSILWIRPDSNASANDWDSTTGTITCNAHTAVQSAPPANETTTGESLWANIFTLGTIENFTHMYIEQNSALLTRYKDASPVDDWWGDGQIDILVSVKEADKEVDEGFLKVFARQHTKTYAYFQTDLTTGGRNPIPLQTGDDLDNTKGDRQMVFTVSSGDFTVGEEIRDDSDATIRGIVTSWVSGTKTLQYYRIGDPINDFSAGSGGLTGQTSLATATAVAPTSVNAATYTSITVTHANNETYDVDENDSTENYSIVINCNSQTLQQVQERLKYITRRGETSTTATDEQQGQFYIGSDYRIVYTALTGTISEGATVTQVSTLATGTVVAHNTADKILILRNSRRTFNTTNEIRLDVAIDANKVTMGGVSTATPLSPNASSPFGTYAGGKFFGASGVVLIPSSVPAADANNYQLTDDNGNVVVPPTKVSVQVANTREKDRIAVFRLTATPPVVINKAEYTNTAQSAGATSVIVGASIATDVPGKTLGGVLRIVDTDLKIEYRLRYSSWSVATFTLASQTGTAESSGCDTDTLTDAGKSFLTTVKVGDLIRNTAESVVAYVTAVVSNTELTTTPVTDWTSDTYEINTLPVATTTGDTTYIPIIDVYEDDTNATDSTSGTAEATVTFVSNISVRVVARNAIDTVSTTTPMLPYTADATIINTGLTNNIIRTLDSIKT
jgi:hypothetical protein